MGEFHFLRPAWLIACIPLALLLWRMSRRKHSSRSWQSVCDPKLLPHLLIERGGRAPLWPLLALGLIGVLAIVALAGPVWRQLPQPVYREQSALVLVLDLSRSMDATDIKPSRLSRARLKIIDILRRRKEGQTALLVFAAQPFAVSPLTQDAATVVAQVPSLTTGLMPAQGSRADLALDKAAELLQQAAATHGHILLVTDGVDNGRVASVVASLRQQGHRLSVLGVGSGDGAPIPIPEGGFLKDASGQIVIPKMDDKSLLSLAEQGGGRYAALTADDRDINYLLAGVDINRLNAQTQETSFQADKWREEGPWLLLLVVPLAALAFRRGWLAMILIICLPLPRPAEAFDWNDLWLRHDQRAARTLQQGKAEQAADEFDNAEWKAAAYYRAGKYGESIKALGGAKTSDGLYNKGNALARAGRLPEALQAYTQALKLEPNNEDARYNRDLIQKRLSQQQSKSQNQNHQNDPKPGNGSHGDSKNGSRDSKGEQQQGNSQKQTGGSRQAVQGDQDRGESGTEQSAANGSQNAARAASTQASHSTGRDEQAAAGNQALSDAAHPADANEVESQQANEQWLRRIPDDPGGLLRRKFLYEYQRKYRQSGNGSDPW
jgi:Ca-activated chloride channel family protein